MATKDKELHQAVQENNIMKVNMLLDQGTSTDSLFYSNSPLDVALTRGYQELAVFLIDKKQNFTAHDNTSRRVFEEAVMKRLWKVVHCLLTHNILLANKPLSYGDTPLSVAVELSCPEMVRVLINGNASVNGANIWKQSALYTACQDGENEIVENLILAGADLNRVHRNNDNFTPLIAAVANDHEETVKLLLKNDINLNAQDTDGLTSLWHAYYNSNEEICELLLQAGAKIDVPNNDGRTVVEDADENEDDEFILLFSKYVKFKI